MDPAIQKLLDESRALRHGDPQAMLALAKQAVRAATRLPQHQSRERCEARACYANALRVCNRFREARVAFRLAWAAFEQVGEPLLAARLHELEASLQEATREFCKAKDSLEKALLIRLTYNDGAAVGACLLKLANVVGHAGDPAAAVRILTRALTFPARDQGHAFAVVHNLAWFLVDAGEADQALTVVLEFSTKVPPPTDKLLLLRARWLSARILAAISKETAVTQRELAAVRDEFVSLNLPFDAALAGLELVSYQDRSCGDARSALFAVETIFNTLGIEREALVAKLLQDAFTRIDSLDNLVPRIVEALKCLSATGKLRLASAVRIDRPSTLP